MIPSNLNRRIILQRDPVGLLRKDDTEVVWGPIPSIDEGQVLVRTKQLAMDPVTRVMIAKDIGFMPRIVQGNALKSFGAGIVVDSRKQSIPIGAHVAGFLEWADFQVLTDFSRVSVLPDDVSFSAALNVHGHTALAAYFGLLAVGNLKAEETVVVTGAAGAVGSVAGQIAKLKRCRVIGVVGGRKKANWIVNELGFDAAIDYKNDDVAARLRVLCPYGVDLLFDNVGGELLVTVAKHTYGRIVLCGASSEYLAPAPTYNAPVEDAVPRLKFNAWDYSARFSFAVAEMLAWAASDKLQFYETRLHGLERAPEALNMLFNGTSLGRVLVEVED